VEGGAGGAAVGDGGAAVGEGGAAVGDGGAAVGEGGLPPPIKLPPHPGIGVVFRPPSDGVGAGGFTAAGVGAGASPEETVICWVVNEENADWT
jgi:hypothetical protein